MLCDGQSIVRCRRVERFYTGSRKTGGLAVNQHGDRELTTVGSRLPRERGIYGLTGPEPLHTMSAERRGNMRLRLFVQTTIAISCSFAVSVGAQSLADAARREQARRQQITHPARVYTNKDLASVPEPAAPPSPAPESVTPADAADPADAKSEKAEGAAAGAAPEPRTTPSERPRDAPYWSGRLKDLTTQLERDRVLLEALQSRINALTADFSSRDDPVQRSLVAADRQKALDELDRMRKSVASDQKAIADFREEARRADVPPGWLR
jgi:hypothetical protein